MFVREGGDCGNDVNAYVFNDTESRDNYLEVALGFGGGPQSSEITGWSRCPTSRQPRSWPSPWTQKSAE